jgi:hypothetical protein
MFEILIFSALMFVFAVPFGTRTLKLLFLGVEVCFCSSFLNSHAKIALDVAN